MKKGLVVLMFLVGSSLAFAMTGDFMWGQGYNLGDLYIKNIPAAPGHVELQDLSFSESGRLSITVKIPPVDSDGSLNRGLDILRIYQTNEYLGGGNLPGGTPNIPGMSNFESFKYQDFDISHVNGGEYFTATITPAYEGQVWFYAWVGRR